MRTVSNPATSVWTLAEFGQGAGQQRTIELPRRELIVGRTSETDVTIPCASVSKRHARLTFEGEHCLVEDLVSTNGTYLNGARTQTSLVSEGDLLQFGNALYRVGKRQAAWFEGTREETIVPWAQTLILFDQLLNDRSVVPHFQPIIRLETGATVGFELLARSNLEGLAHPALLFGAAERLDQQARLSELMREEGLKVAKASPYQNLDFYLNTHPTEVINDRLKASLRDLRADYPDLKITIEIHEAAVTDTASMREFRQVLNELEMQLSYDDFGAGQGRLLELGEVPPDVLKFDMQLIRGIDKAAATRQELLATLVGMARNLGAIPLAEGVETAGEDRVCQQLGFELGQGHFYGRPAAF